MATCYYAAACIYKGENNVCNQLIGADACNYRICPTNTQTTPSPKIKLYISKELWEYTQKTNVGVSFNLWPENLRKEFESIIKKHTFDICETCYAGDIEHGWAGYTTRSTWESFDGKQTLPFRFLESKVEPVFTLKINLSDKMYEFFTKLSYCIPYVLYTEEQKMCLKNLRNSNPNILQIISLCNNGEKIEWYTLQMQGGDFDINRYYRINPNFAFIRIT